MAVREFPLQMVGIAYDCDECGEEMVQKGSVAWLTHPPKFPHECPNGHVAMLNSNYPTTGYRRVEG